MATCFDRWEKDPFFPAAEEVQESADRMESAYRRWIHERKDASNPAGGLTGDLHRELHTALGTAKWQLDELGRAVRSNDDDCSAGEDTRTRHSQFIEAIGNQVSAVENSLKESSLDSGKDELSWVRLDEGERDELAVFLSAPLPPLPPFEKMPVSIGGPEVGNNTLEINGEDAIDCLKNQCRSNGFGQLAAKEERKHGHRRTASAGADMWKISVSSEDKLPNLPPSKTPSFSCLMRVLETTPEMKWSKNGFRKWKDGDQHQEEETIPLHNQQISQGLNACCERSKSYLSSCGDGSYDKQLYGWLGALHRQFQRSQYQIQYGRPIQMTVWFIVIVFLIGIVFRESWKSMKYPG